MKIEWQKTDVGIGFIAAIGNVRLSVSPDHVVTQRGSAKRAEKTKWRAFCWVIIGPGHSCRYGRDIYEDLFSSPGEAMNHAESIYIETRYGLSGTQTNE